MNGDYYVSDILTPDRLHSGFLNVLVCPTGSGKTTAILKELPKYVDENRNRILLITDSNINRSQLVSNPDNKTQWYSKDWREFINASTTEQLTHMGWGSHLKTYITVMNYHQLGTLLHHRHYFDWSKFAYVVLDEAHNLIQYQNIKSKDGTINKVKYAQAKIDATLKDHPHVKIIAVTATPNTVFKKFKNAKSVFTEEEVSNLRQYEVGNFFIYRDIQKLLPQIPLGTRGIIYTSRITSIKKHQEYLISKGHKALGIWGSSNENHPMSEEQYDLISHIVRHQEIPPDIDILLINKAAETGVNITNKDLTFMIIHAKYGSDTFIQAKGRIRNDIPNVHFYESSYNDANIDIPEEYLNTPLNTENKKVLCNEVVRYLNPSGNPYQWGKVKEHLETNGFIIKETHRRVGKTTERVSIITKTIE